MTENFDVKLTPGGIWEGVKGMGRLITVLVTCTAFIISGTVTVCFWLNGLGNKFDKVNEKLDNIQGQQYIQLDHSCHEETDQREFNRGIVKWQDWASNQIRSTGQKPPDGAEVPDNADFCRGVLERDRDHDQNKNSGGHSLFRPPQLDTSDNAGAARIYDPYTGR